MKNARTFLLAVSLSFLTALAADPAPPLGIPYAKSPSAGLLSAGQPTPEQIAAAAAAGYKTVVNLRAESEPGFEWEPDAVRASGMAYVSIPVTGSAGLTRENAVRLDAALKDAEAQGPVLLHCASGNRTGALLALRAAWIEGEDPQRALAYGRAAGLAGLEPKVRGLLGLPAEAPQSGSTSPTP